jgi:DNA-binding protein H-NS
MTMAQEQTSASEVIKLLEKLTVGDLDKVIAAAEQQREAKRESSKKELVEEFRARAEALGLSLRELAGAPEASPSTGKGRSSQKEAPTHSPAVRYRNPETGETWSGRGRAPKWIVLADRQGRSREEFAAKS